jgi:hypothetical protein
MQHIVTELETLVGRADRSASVQDHRKPSSATAPSLRRSLGALRSAVELRTSKPPVAAPVAASSNRAAQEFPLDDNFVEV